MRIVENGKIIALGKSVMRLSVAMALLNVSGPQFLHPLALEHKTLRSADWGQVQSDSSDDIAPTFRQVTLAPTGNPVVGNVLQISLENEDVSLQATVQQGDESFEPALRNIATQMAQVRGISWDTSVHDEALFLTAKTAGTAANSNGVATSWVYDPGEFNGWDNSNTNGNAGGPGAWVLGVIYLNGELQHCEAQVRLDGGNWVTFDQSVRWVQRIWVREGAAAVGTIVAAIDGYTVEQIAAGGTKSVETAFCVPDDAAGPQLWICCASGSATAPTQLLVKADREEGGAFSLGDASSDHIRGHIGLPYVEVEPEGEIGPFLPGTTVHLFADGVENTQVLAEVVGRLIYV